LTKEEGMGTTYFDSVVFLSMFLLIGKYSYKPSSLCELRLRSLFGGVHTRSHNGRSPVNDQNATPNCLAVGTCDRFTPWIQYINHHLHRHQPRYKI
jgi:hypothetical protein